MTNHEQSHDDRREHEEPDVELPGADVDGSQEFIDDTTGASYDEQVERAQAVIDRAHEMEQPEQSESDERPA